MRINNNIPALRSLNQLNKTNTSLDRTLERLSSGLRINRASDDAAGLAITQKMDTQVRGLQQAKRNAMDGISMIQTAEGALNEVHAMLQRIRELSVQVSNGTYDATDRKSVQDEVNQLQDEILRISQNIEFNERKLLNGDIDRRAFPANENIIQIVSLTDSVRPGTYGVHIVSEAEKAIVEGTAINFPEEQIGISGKINLNGEEVTIKDTDTADIVFNKLRSLGETVGVTINSTDAAGVAQPFSFSDGLKIVLESNEYGKESEVALSGSVNLLAKLGLTATTANGEDASATFDSSTSFNSTATLTTNGNIITVSDINGFEMKFEVQEGVANQSTTISVLDAGPLMLQIGANEGQSMEVRIQNLSPKALGIDKINLSTASGAQKAIGIMTDAINMISSVRAKLGAYQNRLEHTVANLDVAAENMTESMSRIQDADMALEMAEYTQKNVLAQAGTAMLAQANQRPQSILQLLQG